MITAGVQQASQAIEIKGAPSAVALGSASEGEEFRTALVANVRDNSARSVAKTAVVVEAADEKSVGKEANTFLATTSCKSRSSKQAQTGSQAAAKIFAVAGKGKGAAASIDAADIVGRTVSLANTSVGMETSTAPSASEIASSGPKNLQTVSTEAALAASSAQIDLSQNGAETLPVRSANVTVASSGLPAAKSFPPNVHAISVASAKEPGPVTATSEWHTRKDEHIGVSKGAAFSVTSHTVQIGQTAQTIQTSSNTISSGSADTKGTTVLPTSVLQTASVTAATEQARISDPVSAAVSSPELADVLSGKTTAVVARGDTRFAALQPSLSSEERSAQSQTSAVVVNQAETLQGANSARIDQNGRDGGTIRRQTATGAEQTMQETAQPAKKVLSNVVGAALSNNSAGERVRVPVSAIDPIALSPGGIDKTIQLQGTAESKSVSTVSGGGIEASKVEALSKPAPTTQHVQKSDAHTGTGPLLKTNATIDGAVVSELPKNGSSDSSLQSADAKPIYTEARSSVPAPVVGQDVSAAGILRATITASASTSAAGKDKSFKRPSDDLDPTAVAQPPASSASSASSVPVVATDGGRDGIHATAASNVLVNPTANPAATAVAVPVQAGGVAVLAGVHPVSDRTGARDGVIAAQASLAAPSVAGTQSLSAAQSLIAIQSVEQHRTLLATPSALEVGVQSGTQGWLKIRAELGGEGEVRASLAAVSSNGSDLLHSQLPALNAFLHSEQISVTASVAERSSAANGGLGGAATESGGYRGGDDSGVANGSLLEGGGGGQQGRQQYSASGGGEMTGSYDALGSMSNVEAGLSGSPAGTSIDSGRWLNVRV